MFLQGSSKERRTALHWHPPRAAENRDAVSQSLVPWRQVKAENTHPHPPPGERKPKAKSAAVGHSVILARHRPRQVCAAPSRPRRPGARLTPARLRPPPGPQKAKFLSRPRPLLLTRRPALGGSHKPAPGGRGHRRRASGESGAADGSRSRDLSPRAGNKSRVRTSGRDRPRLRKGERGGGGEQLSRPPESAPPVGSTGPEGRRGAQGPRSWARGSQRARLEASPAPLAPKHRSGGWETVREGAPKRRGGPRTAKEGIRFPGRRSRPPHPCGHGAGTCRRGCSSAPSLSASPARRSAPSPPSRPSARWTPPPETGSAREPARIPRAAPGAVPPPPAAGPAFHRAPGLSVRPQKARGLSLRLSGLVAARRPCK
ncbi:serine/arginine repetitive matrix protein 1-like [Eumetopias jubatus]|uniref:serine/arginine repetitive matrix protein 1-like n=1 Tax=Eumetopias jubatus TaxID=34886 RepID=UPI000F80CB21|nr:serine/arginine repetitive matrix protein 1-like [Eumetopias jubatus]